MKCFKFFIIPFILSIFLFSPLKISAASKYSVAYRANINDSKIDYYVSQLLENPNLDISNKRVYVGLYSDSWGYIIVFNQEPIKITTTNYLEGEVAYNVYYDTPYLNEFSTYVPTYYNDVTTYRGYELPFNSGSSVLSRVVQLPDGRFAVFGSGNCSSQFVVDISSLTFNAPSSTPLDIDTEGFSDWLEQNPEFKDFIINNAPWLNLESKEELKYLIDYYNNYGMYSDSFMLNHKHLNDITIDGSTLPTPQQYDILRNMLKQQYNKFVLSQNNVPILPTNPPYVNNNPVSVPDDTLNQPIIIQNNNDFNYYYLREIIRLIGVDISNDNSYHNTDTNILNNIASVLNNIDFNISPIVNTLGNINLNLGDINDKLDGLLIPIVSIGDKINDISLKLDSGGSGNCNYDESFWELMLVPTFDEFDEIHAEFTSKFPIVNEIATISLDGDIPTIENKLPDKELDNLIEGGLVPVAFASEGGLPSGQNPYGFSYSESEITSSDLFTFTMPTGTNSWLDKFNGMEISLINFKKFNTAIQFFKGIIGVLAVFAFTKWLLNFVPKLATGASTGDG